MLDHSPHEGLKGEVAHLWNHNRPLAVTILVGIAAVVYIVWKKNQAGGMSAPAGSTTPAGTPGMFYQTYITENKTIVPAAPSPIAPVPIPTPNPGIPPAAPPTYNPPTNTLPVPSNPITGSNKITPIIPYNQLPAGTRYSTAQDLQQQPTLTWMGMTYKKVPGSNGLLWGNPVNGGPQVLLYGPPSAY